MIYPENALEKLGFNDIKELIKNYCLSDMGIHMVEKMQFMHNFEHINKFLNQTAEFKSIIEDGENLPIAEFFNLKNYIDKIKLEGAYLLEEEIYKLYKSVQTVFTVLQFFEGKKGNYPYLEALFERLIIEKSIINNINEVLDIKGKIKNNASAKLNQITSDLSKTELEARKKIDQIFKNAQNNNWLADGSLTVREGRMCIPLLAENKRKVKGFIHDESASGQTVYLEPEEVFYLNNLIRDLEFEKRREIIRILTNLTNLLRPYIPILISYQSFLTKLDFVRAKSLFAIALEAEMPILKKDNHIILYNAKHPLLSIKHEKLGKEIVPLNIKLTEANRIILISGPNAGGKSVAMKTVGLLQIMVQSGLLVPVAGHSEFGIFKQLFVDIGDDQSIESDLSTYSAHLSKMKYFTEFANGKTLLLIDEFGTGTDPQFGGPIAEAVLETLNKKRAYGIITTHYSNLKVFANHTAGLENASMIFDHHRLQPLYILELGKPGSSYAFEIAKKIGLSSQVIDLAKNKIGVQQRKIENMLVDLEKDKRNVLELKANLEKQEKKFKHLVSENEKQQLFLDENKNKLIKNAKIEAQNIIKNANKLVENTIAEIKENNADKQKTKQLRANLESELVKNETAKLPIIKLIKNELIEEGNWVKVLDTGNIAQVIEVNKQNLILAFGELRSVIKQNRVEKLLDKDVPKELKSKPKLTNTQLASDFSVEIDIRGFRGDDALYKIEQYFDKAVMLGLPSFKIIHGKGDGILRKLIRNYLNKYPQVNRLEDEHADRGGDGITYVYLN